MSRPVKSGPSVGKVPGPAGATRFFAMKPAMASTGTIIRKRPPSMASPRVVFQKWVLAFRPAKAEPLLAAALVYA